MQIGEIIRKYRKEKNMTQEEMANRLGVTAPAVNKWESGASMPDILLLAPIARLLGITVDGLLSFEESLTDEEINRLVAEAGKRLKEEKFETVFQWAKGLLEQYPNCEKLTLYLAAELDSFRLTSAPAEMETYDAFIREAYKRALKSGDGKLRETAAQLLWGVCIREERYEEAEKYLEYFSEKDPERKRMQAFLYEKAGRREEAYRAYEELLLSEYMLVSTVFYSLFSMAVKEQDMERAEFLLGKGRLAAQLFEGGEYREYSCVLELAKEQKDVEKTLECASKMLYGVDSLEDFRESKLYGHIKFKTLDADFCRNLRKQLVALFRDETEFGYMKDCERWEELLSFFA